MNTRRGRVGTDITHPVTPGNTQGYYEDTFAESGPRAVLTPEKETVRQNGRRFKKPNEPMFTLTVRDRHGVIHNGRGRQLTPRE